MLAGSLAISKRYWLAACSYYSIKELAYVYIAHCIIAVQPTCTHVKRLLSELFNVLKKWKLELLIKYKYGKPENFLLGFGTFQ